ncbi:M23 family metallopeptidase [Pelagibacterium flavum]|uniref:M23 family metallopeptidase n=1 Tax=Pelagibacterium flavum TaxID=2984530 RepID=A0ABY6IIR4_9HYPH|nr:M23 family metallopeptidase [Pelagibacterium sp. YIM 151497]UYQ70487.1 M23 family metallopeptidase [Pelagibacterium sp. YIM 151497]|tara:strand:+ start:1755 stop:2906 length:1152 start_codon:yes stop_codon:yes gene_type:complete
MTLSVTGSNLRSAGSALAMSVAALVLAGCSSMGSFGGDPTVTGSTSRMGGAAVGQAMPAYLPPANIGGGAVGVANTGPVLIDRTTASPVGTQSAVVSQDLPALQPSSVTSTQAMPAQTAAVSSPSPTPSQPTQSSSPQLGVVQGDTYKHTIASGESLYTIARRYDVSATDIIAANNITSPDKIVVGQSLVIPGRPDLLAQRGQTQQVAAVSGSQTLATPSSTPANSQTATPAPAAQPAPEPTTQVAAAPTQQPTPAATASVTSDKFRWPLSGRVITDFAASRGTGINIEAPEGTSVRAAENGEVIYVGNAVEGYGNLVLVKHANGFVSAYAHLSTIGVVKGDTISRGDAIGTVGMTGSVSRPQLHFELRKGATPVDPMPLLAG